MMSAFPLYLMAVIQLQMINIDFQLIVEFVKQMDWDDFKCHLRS